MKIAPAPSKNPVVGALAELNSNRLRRTRAQRRCPSCQRDLRTPAPWWWPMAALPRKLGLRDGPLGPAIRDPPPIEDAVGSWTVFSKKGSWRSCRHVSDHVEGPTKAGGALADEQRALDLERAGLGAIQVEPASHVAPCRRRRWPGQGERSARAGRDVPPRPVPVPNDVDVAAAQAGRSRRPSASRHGRRRLGRQRVRMSSQPPLPRKVNLSPSTSRSPFAFASSLVDGIGQLVALAEGDRVGSRFPWAAADGIVGVRVPRTAS